MLQVVARGWRRYPRAELGAEPAEAQVDQRAAGWASVGLSDGSIGQRREQVRAVPAVVVAAFVPLAEYTMPGAPSQGRGVRRGVRRGVLTREKKNIE